MKYSQKKLKLCTERANNKMEKKLFPLVCIPARLLFSAAVFTFAHNYILKLVALVALLVISIGFWSIYLFGWRKTGPEVGGKEIWWNAIRPIHGSIYAAAFTSLLCNNNKLAGSLLFIDTVIGVVAHTKHHYFQ